MEKGLVFLTVFAVALMIVALTIFIHMHQKYINDGTVLAVNNTKTAVCLTPGCIKAAAEILNSLDESMDPCHDFYRFACGGWLDARNIPEDRSWISIDSEVRDNLNKKLKVLLEKPLMSDQPEFIVMLRTMYNSCMDIIRIESLEAFPLQESLRKIGGWPVVVGSKWNHQQFNWIDMLIAFRKLGYNHDLLLSLSVVTDYKNNNKFIIKLDQPKFGMPDRSYYLKGFNNSLTVAYFEHMVTIATKLGADPEIARDEFERVLDFETQLANMSYSQEERRNFSLLYNKYTVEQLQAITPEIDWLKYFNGLLTHKITSKEPINVSVANFIPKFAKLLATSDQRTVANYMVWRIVKESLSLLSKEYRMIHQEYASALHGTTREKPRWEICLSTIGRNLDAALGSYYVRHYFKNDSKISALEMIDYIQKEFLHILDTIDWMDEVTKRKAIEKTKAMESYIGYPEELLNDNALSDYYANLTMTEESYYHNELAIKRWKTDYSFNQLRKPKLRGDWTKHARAAVVNAYYSGLENGIEIPAGILQSPFFDKDRPGCLNYGAIGTVIGHEITHGFDDLGRQFDKDGNNLNWWEPKTDEQFRKKAQCFIDQYSNFTIPGINMNINGINTQGENIADNGGLKEAYWAYHAWTKTHGEEPWLPGLKYSPIQLFWISAANSWCAKLNKAELAYRVQVDEHCPDEFRVTIPFSNMKEFAKDFKCSVNSAMNIAKKCEVW